MPSSHAGELPAIVFQGHAWYRLRSKGEYLGGLVQGVAAEEAELLDVVHAGQALGHHALLAALGQHLALLRHVLHNLLGDARLRLRRE